jgi:hypothetical protein
VLASISDRQGVTPNKDGYFPMFCRLLASTPQMMEVAVFLRTKMTDKKLLTVIEAAEYYLWYLAITPKL